MTSSGIPLTGMQSRQGAKQFCFLYLSTSWVPWWICHEAKGAKFLDVLIYKGPKLTLERALQFYAYNFTLLSYRWSNLWWKWRPYNKAFSNLWQINPARIKYRHEPHSPGWEPLQWTKEVIDKHITYIQMNIIPSVAKDENLFPSPLVSVTEAEN